MLIHGGGSTIGTTFGTVLPMLAKTHRVIAVELQAHGHTSDRDAPETFTQDADDVAELLRQLNVTDADILGFSNGGQTAMELAMRHPARVRRLVLASVFYKRSGVDAGFWDMMKNATLGDMPQSMKDAFTRINPDPAALMNMFRKDAQRMRTITGWTDAEIRTITAPSFVIAADQDVARPEHAVEMFRILPHARLAIFPGGHGAYLGESSFTNVDPAIPAAFVSMMIDFRAAPLDGQRQALRHAQVFGASPACPMAPVTRLTCSLSSSYRAASRCD